MKIIESDVSGVWGPEIKAVASQAKAAHRPTDTHTPCRASKAAAWLIKADGHPSWPPGAEPVGLGLSLRQPQESSLTLGHKHPSAPAHPLPYPTTPGGKISWNTLACEWNIRSLYNTNSELEQLQGQCYCRTQAVKRKKKTSGVGAKSSHMWLKSTQMGDRCQEGGEKTWRKIRKEDPKERLLNIYIHIYIYIYTVNKYWRTEPDTER